MPLFTDLSHPSKIHKKYLLFIVGLCIVTVREILFVAVSLAVLGRWMSVERSPVEVIFTLKNNRDSITKTVAQYLTDLDLTLWQKLLCF